MFNGYMPEYIDHINMDRQDNRIENLRDATSSLNNHNKAKRSDNTSGVKGVSWSKSVRKWHARIHVNKNLIFSEYFEDIEVAKNEIEKQRRLLKLP